MRVTIASLETMGAVSGEPDPTDGRQTVFSLTPSSLVASSAHNRMLARKPGIYILDEGVCIRLENDIRRPSKSELAYL
jgi:DNA-binding MarR family transcriptional regulator